MKVPRRPRDSGVRFNITPLIDICFNLIVFFALASLAMRKGGDDPINLPQLAGGEVAGGGSPRRLTVTIRADRRMFLAGQEISLLQLERRLHDQKGDHPDQLELRIRADRTVPFGEIKPMILSCAQQGVTNLKFAVK